MAIEVIALHKVQPDYEKRMKMISRAARFWVQPEASIPMSLVPTEEELLNWEQGKLIDAWIKKEQAKQR